MQQIATSVVKHSMMTECATTVILWGEYHGAAHSACNLKLRIYAHKTKVPVVFHNLRGYDGHLIMSAVGASEAVKNQKIYCIPNNMEKYTMFSVGQLQFMNSSLDKLSANLQTENLAITRRGLTDKALALLRRKGVYPYEYVDNIERFDETQLPPIEAFYSNLSSCLLYTSPSPRDGLLSRMPSSA